MEYVVLEKNKSQLNEQANYLNSNAWPKFVDGEKVMRYYWGFIEDNFPDYQLLLIKDNVVLANINSAAFLFTGKDEELHQNGIYWGLHRVAHDYYKKNKPNTLLALQVIVNPDYKGYGLSYSCVKELINFGREKGYQRLVIPLRPSMKHMYPLMDIEKYMRWNNDDGFPYDPWLRVHVKLGGRLIKPCKGVTVEGLIEEWEKWTGLKFPYSCEYTIPQALNTINVNVINRTIVYAQDNVWVVHNLA